MTTGADKLQEITINKEFTEYDAINSLDTKMFNESWTGNLDDLKNTLKGTEIKIEWATEDKKTMKLLDIATDFDKYVDKVKWSWKLKLKDESNKNNPEWIKNIIEKPANNDLAFFIQKVANLISYQTAFWYINSKTKDELAAMDISPDKTFGNQTRRALAGLKTWIESTDREKKYITMKELNTFKDQNKLPEWIVYDAASGDYKAAEWYERIDPNSNNYAVIMKNTSWEYNEKKEVTYQRNDDNIKKQLQWSWLDNDNELMNNIKTKKYELDNFEYKWRFMIIKDGKISIYSNKTTYDNMIKQETADKRWKSKEKKIQEILLDLEKKTKNTRKDSSGNLLFENLPWVSFQNIDQIDKFKIDIIKIIRRWWYALENGNKPFNVSSNGNIYINTKNWKIFIEDNTIINGTVSNMKNIEEFKNNVSNDELNNIVNFLNELNCRSAKEKFNDIAWPFWTE